MEAGSLEEIENPNITWKVTLQIQVDATDYPDAVSMQEAITSALDPIGIVDETMKVSE